MSHYNIITTSSEETVVSEYTPNAYRVGDYQSEADLENEFVANLKAQGYSYLVIHKESDLVANLRTQLSLLNNYHFSDNELKHFYDSILASANEGIVEKTRRIQEDHVQVLKCDDGKDRKSTRLNSSH